MEQLLNPKILRKAMSVELKQSSLKFEIECSDPCDGGLKSRVCIRYKLKVVQFQSCVRVFVNGEPVMQQFLRGATAEAVREIWRAADEIVENGKLQEWQSKMHTQGLVAQELNDL